MIENWFDASAPGFRERFVAFLRERRFDATGDIEASARDIVRDVRSRGGEAVAEYTRRFDRLEIDPTTLQSSSVNLDQLSRACPESVGDALAHAAKRIEAFHRLQVPSDKAWTDDDEITLGWKWSSLDSVGIYVPGGRASYPSSLLMNAIPARIAGVPRIVLVSPSPDGRMSPAVAHAAKLVGITEFYPIGGAQAVSALAFGAGALSPVDKIVGPGNAYVAAAKRQVYGVVGIDAIAGPSELTIVADATTRIDWIAADLLSQAEHDPLSQSILISSDAGYAQSVCAEIDRILGLLGAESSAAESWRRFGAVVIADRSMITGVVDLIAPEHVEIATASPELISADIKHAGAIFIGKWSPEALGDYATGSNHVLPTSGAARFSSGLSTTDFMKRTSIQKVTRRGFERLASTVQTLAEAEGLPAHALSVSIRRVEE